jgi:DNA-binding Xre family transcriptional regulator
MGRIIFLKIHNKRIKESVTEKEIADWIGMTRQALNKNLYDMKNNVSTLKTITKICDVLKLDIFKTTEEEKEEIEHLDRFYK